MIERIVHCIPVGGKEPMHMAHESCSCHPLLDEGVMIHNAFDLREARERHRCARDGEKWVLVASISTPTTG